MQEYTQYKFYCNKIIKYTKEKYDVDFSIEQLCGLFLKARQEYGKDDTKLVEFMNKNGGTKEDFNNESRIIGLEGFFIHSKGFHYFIPDEKLYEFIINSVKEYNISLLSILPISGIINFPKSLNIKPLIFGKVVLAGSEIFIMQSQCTWMTEKESFYGSYLNIPMTINQNEFNEEIKKLKSTNGENIKYLNLLFGLSLYLKCFPHALRNGIPEDCLHQNYYKKSINKTVATIDEIIDTSKRTITPHIRSGYFKLLQSDYFTKMKGQVIFIHECFVKGKAKTVENETKEVK